MPPLLPLLLTPPRPPMPPPKPPSPLARNCWPSLTGTLRPTLVSFAPPSSTCIWVLCRSFDLPRDCSKLICDGGKPISVPTPPRNGVKRLPPIEVPPWRPWNPPSPIPPRLESDGVWVVVVPTMLPLVSVILVCACTGDC